jgi:hypothetical protein
MNAKPHSLNVAFPDPFAEIERRHEADWKHLFLAEPHLLEHDAGDIGATRVIRCWDEIADVFTVAMPATEWIVQGILPRASVTLLAGEPGSYKTWLALALLRGVAGGGSFLGRKCVETSVLYLDRENPLAVMRERLAVLGIESLGNSRIWGGWLADAPPAIGDARLVEIARERRPLIIFDSLIRFHDAADENSATEMASVMGDLRALANAGATVVALHHKPKSEGALYRGSSDIAGGVDTAWAVSRDRDAGLLRLECFKSRYAEEFSLTLRPDLGTRSAWHDRGERGPSVAMLPRDANPGRIGDFVVSGSPEAASEQSDVEKLADAIRSKPGQSGRSIVEASGLPKGRARFLLERHDGKLWRSQLGPRRANLYFPVATTATAGSDA